jgi:uncharacterized protein (TIRG00374 family)
LRQQLIRVLRIVVSVGLLGWVLHRADLGSVIEQLSRAKLEWILAAFAVNSLGNLFGAWRWQLLLRSQGRRVSVPYLYGSDLVGLFFNNFLPSTIGGDVVRASSARRKGGGTMTEGLTVVLVERMIGLFATLSLGVLAALTGRAGELDPRIPWVVGSAFLTSVGGIYFAISRKVRRILRPIVDRIPIAFVRETVSKMVEAFELFSRSRPTLVANYGLSLVFQFLLIVHFWLIQFAFGESVSFVTFVAVVPLVFCVMMLPIGINGLGVRESAFVWFMTRGDMMDMTTATVISLATYLIAVAQGILGGGVHLWREANERGSAADEAQESTGS